jgi:hypothetical protein
MADNSAYQERLARIMAGMSSYGEPASLGAPGDRGPNPAVPISKRIKIKKIENQSD